MTNMEGKQQTWRGSDTDRHRGSPIINFSDYIFQGHIIDTLQHNPARAAAQFLYYPLRTSRTSTISLHTWKQLSPVHLVGACQMEIY